MDSLEIVRLMNAEDKLIAQAVERELPRIAEAVDMITKSFELGGRLVYVGCGTSGRLAVLDASECPVTFGVPEGQVVGIIAGGLASLLKSREGIEDHEQSAVADLDELGLQRVDTVVGLTASGRTPYVLGAVRHARHVGCATVGVCCNAGAPLSAIVDVAIAPVVGAEVVAGSTRLKAGTAQKMVLNMLSTGALVRSGKCFGNLMVDVRGNACVKLQHRARRIVAQIADCTDTDAADTLLQCDYEVKPAILMRIGALTKEQARQLLADNEQSLRKALAQLKQPG